MSECTPDYWIVLKVNGIYKVLAGWAGSYLYGQSWKLNSGIVKVEEDGEYYLFHGYSGSVYRCHKRCYGKNLIMSQIFYTFKEQAEKEEFPIEELDGDTNWMEISYEQVDN
jgi:hypothetical protein